MERAFRVSLAVLVIATGLEALSALFWLFLPGPWNLVLSFGLLATIVASGIASVILALMRRSRTTWRPTLAALLGVLALAVAEWPLRVAGQTLFFYAHRRELEAITSRVSATSTPADAASAARAAEQAGFSLAEAGDTSVVFVRSGLIDNLAGYLYVRPGVAPPGLHSELAGAELVYLRSIAPHWYYFATT